MKKIVTTAEKLKSLKSHQQAINLGNQNRTENAKPIANREEIVKLIEYQKNFVSMKNEVTAFNKGSKKLKIRLPRHKLDIISQERCKSRESQKQQAELIYGDSAEKRGRSIGKYNIGLLLKNIKLDQTQSSLRLKSLRLSKQAID